MHLTVCGKRIPVALVYFKMRNSKPLTILGGTCTAICTFPAFASISYDFLSVYQYCFTACVFMSSGPFFWRIWGGLTSSPESHRSNRVWGSYREKGPVTRPCLQRERKERGSGAVNTGTPNPVVKPTIGPHGNRACC